MQPGLFAMAGISIRQDGVCEHLQHDGRCAIYERRPDFCRVGHSRPDEISEQVYMEWTANICNLWMSEDGVPVELRIDPSIFRTETTHAITTDGLERAQGEEPDRTDRRPQADEPGGDHQVGDAGGGEGP